MSDLISRKALLKVLKEHEQEWNNTYYVGLGLRIAISEVVDVYGDVEVIHKYNHLTVFLKTRLFFLNDKFGGLNAN